MRGYDRDIRFDAQEFERLRATIRAHPTVLLFTHKTYGDAALPGLMLYINDLPMLHTFGGINLDFPGFGTLMRRSGGIFIRRSFQDDPVYKLVLRKYVAYLLEKRFPMSWALEGTRSRLGKLMPPRFGLLKYALDAAHDAGIENLHVVPFVTSFETIPATWKTTSRSRPVAPRSPSPCCGCWGMPGACDARWDESGSISANPWSCGKHRLRTIGWPSRRLPS